MSPSTRSTELRLARLHLRSGIHPLARVELEALAGGDRLDHDGILDLAEVRWRSGDLVGASAAASAWLEEMSGDSVGREALLAHVISAEAAAAEGDVAGAAAHVEAAVVGLAGPGTLDAVLAGIAARAAWPVELGGPMPAAAPAGARGAETSPARGAPHARPRNQALPPPITPAATALVQQGAALVRSAPERAAIVLALALRADRAAAEAVLEALGSGTVPVPDGGAEPPTTAAPEAGPALAFVRAEALWAAGRHEEARIAYASAERLALAPAEAEPPRSAQ
jgi:hypothetical protein